jgi:PAS domain S-box-containing protein
MSLITDHTGSMARSFGVWPIQTLAVPAVIVRGEEREIPDPWTTRLIRAGFGVMFLYQLVHLLLLMMFTSLSGSFLGLEQGFNLASTVLALALTWSAWYRRYWRELVFAECSAMVLSSVVLSAVTATPIQFFLAAVLLQVGAAAVIPWGWRWQLGFLGICGLAGAAMMIVTPDGLTAHLWLGLATASGLALFVAMLEEHHRRETRLHLEALQESETRLWKVFEANPDAVTVARLADCRYINVSRKFLDLGFTREQVLAASDRELGIWDSETKRRDYWGRLRTRGFVNNMNAALRFKDGQVAPYLVSAVVIDLSRGPCVISVMRNISEIKQAEQELAAARDTAQKASRAKSDFLASMSHEIRTPMNAILGMAEVLADTELNDAQRKYLSVMMNNGNTLLDLIDDILDLSQIESGKLELERADFDLYELADKVAETLSIRAHKHGLELAVRIAPQVPRGLVGDSLRLRQVLINLIGNAIKFTPTGEIVLSVECEPGTDTGALHFTVTDTGVGIAEDLRERIFASYGQAETSTARHFGGNGLGLAIAKQIVELMDGKIWVESELGKGTSFHFTARFGVKPESDEHTTDLTGRRILIVDDTAVNRQILGEILRNCGAIVSEAASGADALRMMHSAADGSLYQLILLDDRMPEMSGCEMLLQMRTDRLDAPAVVPMLSADDLETRLPLWRDAHLSHYLIKPVRRTELFSAIANALGVAYTDTGPRLDARQPDPQAAPQLQSLIAQEALPAHASGEDLALRVLVADDSADNRLLIQLFLSKAGCTLDQAENGEVAVAKFIAGHYDVVLMDIHMPGMDGYTATREIRQWEREHGQRHTPIIALTASVLDEAVNKIIEAGCDSQVSKPVRRQTLIAALREVRTTIIRQRKRRAAKYPAPTPASSPRSSAGIRK